MIKEAENRANEEADKKAKISYRLHCKDAQLTTLLKLRFLL